MFERIQLFLLFLALVACPIAYGWILSRMRARAAPNIPVLPMFFLFGTLGGWLLAFALSPSGLAALCTIFLTMAAPTALLASSIDLARLKARSSYHNTAMWFGFSYPGLLGLYVWLA